MKSTAEIIRDLAISYGIEILDKPTGHVVVDEHGFESPLRTENLSQVFDLPSEELSPSDFVGAEICKLIQNQHSSLIVSNIEQAVFNTHKNIDQTDNTQYSMAA